MGAEPITSSLLLEGAVELVVHAAGSPLHRLLKRMTGRKILILGPPGTGKTSFAKYLRFGILADDEVRVRSSGVETHSSFSVEIAKGQRLNVNFNYMKAVPGQVEIDDQVRTLKTTKAHLALVILDMTQYSPPSEASTSETEMIAWFERFCRSIVMHNSRTKEKTRQRLKMVVALNKVDKVTQAFTHQARRRIANAIDTILSQQFSEHARDFAVQPCCLVDNVQHATHRDKLMRIVLAELQ